MIQFPRKLAIALTFLAMTFLWNAQDVPAQDHFIGEGQSVNRVIKLRSASMKKVTAKRVVDKTSRGDVVERRTTNVASPSQIQFDEIQVPQALAQQPVIQQPSAPNVFQQMKSTSPAKKATKQQLTTETVESSLQVSAVKHQVATVIRAPRFVNVNQKTQFQFDIRNMGEDVVNGVKLVVTLPPHAKFVSATPKPTRIDGQQHFFHVPKIVGQQQQQVQINLIPTQKLPLEMATQLIIENQQHTVVGVQQPQLTINLVGPEQTTTGKTVAHAAKITNIGDGVATNVQIETILPSTLEQSSTVDGVIAEIQPGQSYDVQLNSRALTPGQGTLKVIAKLDSSTSEQATMDVVVFQPELRLSASGPKINFVDRDGIYSVNVENTGEVDVTHVVVSLMVPEGMKVTTISRQADVDANTGMLTWHFDRLAAKSNEQIQLKATALKEGNQVCNIRIKSDETLDKEFLLSTQVSTRADLSVRIKNQTGPVQVGATAEFLVEVENHGSRQAQGINVNVALPESLMPAKDSENASQFGNALVFEQPMINAGEKVAFKFKAIGVSQGDHVVRSTLRIADSERSIISEDSVYVYEVDQARISETLSPVVPR